MQVDKAPVRDAAPVVVGEPVEEQVWVHIQIVANIALKLGVSKATVSRRISKLEQQGYISGYTILTSPTKLGLMRAMVGLEVVGPAVSSVIEELRQFEEIEYVHKVFGDHSLLCEIYAKSVDSLYDLIQNRILKVSSIQNVVVDIRHREDTAQSQR